MDSDMRWVEFKTNCRCREGRFRPGDTVRLPASTAITLISFGHCIARHDLDTESQNVDVLQVIADKVNESEQPKVRKMLKPDNKLIHTTRNKRSESRIRDDWLSLSEALVFLGLTDSSSNRTFLRTLVDKHEIRGEIREGLRPAYQFDRVALEHYKAKREAKR